MARQIISKRLSERVVKRQTTISDLCLALGINPREGETGGELWDRIVDGYLALAG